MSSKELVIDIFTVIIAVVLCAFAPDTTSMVFVIIMSLFVFFGVFVGVRAALLMSDGFSVGVNRIKDCENVDIVNHQRWLHLRKVEHMFNNKILDELFNHYRVAVEQTLNRNGKVIPDIEDYINEDVIEVKMKHSIVSQISGALTGLGILGTFVGLVMGISSLAFSSVDSAIVSVTEILAGIKIAFYTSICSVGLSVCFTFLYNWFHNKMIERYYAFVEMFHREVIPSTKEQMENNTLLFQQNVLQYLESAKQESEQ